MNQAFLQDNARYFTFYPDDYVGIIDQIAMEYAKEEKYSVDFNNLDKELQIGIGRSMLYDPHLREYAEEMLCEIINENRDNWIGHFMLNQPQKMSDAIMDKYLDAIKGKVEFYLETRIAYFAEPEYRKEREESYDFCEEI